MIASARQAVDEIYTMLQDAWLADTATQGIRIVWQGVDHQLTGQTDSNGDPTSFLHVSALHDFGKKASLLGPDGSRTEYNGTLIVQLHTQRGKGSTEALDLIDVAVKAFTGKSSQNGVWFRNTQYTDVGPVGTWYVMSMTTTFVYDLVR